MRTLSLPSIVLLTALPVQAASEPTQAPRGPAAGVVVEEVSKGSPAEKAGIQPGDRLLSWSRTAATADASPARGEIRTFFDLQDVEGEQVPRGAVTLHGLRGSEPFSVMPPPGEWRMKTRPEMPDQVLTPYLEGRKQIEAKQADEGLGSWRRAIEAAKRGRDHALTCLLLLRMGGALADAARWDEAHAAYRDALETARRARLTLAEARVREAEGKAFEKQGDPAKAEAAYLEELKLVEGLEARSLRTARVLSLLAELMDDRPDTGPAKEYYRKTLALREALAPGSLVMADTVNNIGVEAWKEGGYDVAEQNFKRTLAIRESLVPGTAPVAAALNNVGVLAWARGDLASAQELLGKAVATQEGLDPGSKSVADGLNNLGLVATDRGDLAAAEDLLKRALRIYEDSKKELDVALALHNVGNVLTLRGELDAAEAFHRRSLAIKERLAPDSLDLAFSLANLASVVQERGELAAAEDLARRALAIRERLVPDTVEVAVSLSVLGNVLELRGELDAAQDAIRRGVAIEERLAPGGYRLAELLGSAGSILEKRGQLQAAEDLYQRGLAIKARLSPASAAEAQFLHSLGTVCRKTARAREAADYYRRAVEALDAQRGKLGGSTETRSAFSAKYAQYYKDYIEILLELKDPEGALQVLERSRARALLAMLAERDLVFSDLPADVAREMKLADAEYDRTQAAIAGLNPEKQGDEIERQLGRLRELRQGREQIAAKIRRTSPRLASLHYPAPLDLAGVRSSLDPGSVLLAYSVGKDRTVLFVVEPAGGASRGASGLSVLTVPVGEEALREKVRAFRNVIARRSASDREALIGRARELYDALLKPAEPLIAQAQRVLISPDGPLHILPFGALMRDQPAGRKAKAARHLIEWKPLHVVVSATVYAELKKTRREPAAAPARIAAFGDPKYPAMSTDPAESVANPELRSVLTRAGAFASLPFSREEVEGIAGLYPGAAETHLGEQATEETAKAVGRDVRYLHFACHGLLDERFPLNSALALTIPEKPQEGGDNGLLQAWEIFERMRIEAELVSLSACETGLGKELGGEGLLGLARAFQYAGARSVLASLWSVSDESTADLMKRFYAYLKAGRSKDDALRAAQLELMRSPRASHPFHWAAFQLLGDWK